MFAVNATLFPITINFIQVAHQVANIQVVVSQTEYEYGRVARLSEALGYTNWDRDFWACIRSEVDSESWNEFVSGTDDRISERLQLAAARTA